MTLFLQNLLNGFSAGSLYALLAVGIVLVYKSSEVLNFGHGAFAMLSTFVAYHAAVVWGFGLLASFAIALAFAFVLGAVIYRVLLDRAREGGEHAVVMVTIGLLLVFEGTSGAIWGTDTKAFHHLFDELRVIELPGGVFLTHHDAWIIATALTMVVTLALFFRFTRVGIALRAVSQNEVAAQLMGVRVARVQSLIWGIATVLGAIAGILTAPKQGLEPAMMFSPLLKAFAAAVLGGVNSVAGAIIGGWLLGVIEVFAGAYIDPAWQASIAFLIIVLVLTVRPEGLLGKPEVKKV